MSIKIFIQNDEYLASQTEYQDGVFRAEDLYRSEVVENAVICAGNGIRFSEIEPLLRAFARLHAEGVNCYMLLEEEGEFFLNAKAYLREAGLADRILPVSKPQEFEAACREYIDLSALGQARHYFRKSKEFVDNHVNAIYGKLKNLY